MAPLDPATGGAVLTYLDFKLIEMLLRPGGVTRTELEQFPNWREALKSIAKRNDLVRGTTPAGERYYCVKGRERDD